MELLTLDSNYQPAELVERYASLLWTERYFKTGDFQLVTTDVERMLKLLPLESCVTLRESTVPMIVEVHKIQKSMTGAPVLTVTGRSFESVLERRVSIKFDREFGTDSTALPVTRVAWIEPADKRSDAAYQVLRQVIGDRARDPLSSQLPIIANDALSMVDLTLPADYVYPPTTEYTYEVKPGNLYTTVMDMMVTNHHALKAVRPVPGLNKVGIEIYNGADLTNTVAFNAKYDQFEDSTYLLSHAGSSNMAYVTSKSDSALVNKTEITPEHEEPTELERRVLYLDISSEENVESDEARDTRGLIELYKYNATAMFDGQISQQIAAAYNNDYSLGDIIRLDGEYGLSQFVRIAEFIRSDDNTGSKAYPTFEAVSI